MLLSSVASHVRNSIGDRGGIFSPDDLIILWCNEAIQDIFRKTDLGSNTNTNLGLASGTSVWTPDRLIRINSIYNSTIDKIVTEKKFDWLLDNLGPDYIVTPGDPRFYYTTLVSGTNSITFVPTPDKATAIKINWTALPEAFDDIGDDLSAILPENYFYDVIRFCVMRAHEKEKDFRASEKAQEHYNNNLAERRNEAHRLDDDYFSISADPYDYI